MHAKDRPGSRRQSRKGEAVRMRRIGRLSCARRCVAGAALRSADGPGAAQGAADFPNKPITLIMPWPAGPASTCGIAPWRRRRARSSASPSSSTTTGRQRHGRSRADGRQRQARRLHDRADADHGLPPAVMQKTPCDPLTDFTYIIHLSGYMFGVGVRADCPFKTFKRHDRVRQGQSGQGHLRHAGRRHLAAHRHGADRAKAGIKLTQVPFKGGPETWAALRRRPCHGGGGGRGLVAAVDAGQFRVLVHLDREAQPALPDTPTLKELGYPLRVRFALRARRPQGHGPGDRQEAARCLQEGHERAQGHGDPEALRLRHALHEQRGLHAVRATSSSTSSGSVIEQLGLGEEILSAAASRAGAAGERCLRNVIRNSELWGGLFWLAIGAFVIWAGRDMGLGTLHEPGSGFAFFWIGILMCALVAGGHRPGRSSPAARRWPRSGTARAGARCWWSSGCCWSTAWASSAIGFIPCTLALLLVLMWFVDPVGWWLAMHRLPSSPRSACGRR